MIIDFAFYSFLELKHPESAYIPAAEVPFPPIWGQDAPPHPPLVPYPDFISGFPCSDMAIWPRSQINSLVNQRLSPRGGLPAPSNNPAKKPRRRVASMAQRRAANIRERRRMFNLNEAFDKLRRKVSFFFLVLYYITFCLLHPSCWFNSKP